MISNGDWKVLALLVQNLLFVGIAVCYWRRQRLTAAAVGYCRPTCRQTAQWLALGVGVFVAAYVGGALLERILAALLPPHQYLVLVKQNRQMTAEGDFLTLGRSLWLKAAFITAGTLVAPIGEEALFRGLIYRAIRARWGVWPAVFGSSLLFAVVHLSPLTMGVIFAIGVALALAYERTGSLWASIILHGVNNGLMFALLWRQTG